MAKKHKSKSPAGDVVTYYNPSPVGKRVDYYNPKPTVSIPYTPPATHQDAFSDGATWSGFDGTTYTGHVTPTADYVQMSYSAPAYHPDTDTSDDFIKSYTPPAPSGYWTNETQQVAQTRQVPHYYNYDTLDPLMRQRTVHFTVTGLSPVTQGFYLKFNGQILNVTPDSGFIFDSNALRATTDSNGTFSGSFTIPANTPVGTVQVGFSNDRDTAVANYTANGRTQHTGVNYTTETYYTTVTNRVYHNDPIAETFNLPQDYFITSLDLYFGSKDASEPISVDIRPTDSAGYPEDGFYVNQLIMPQDINVDQYGNTKTNVQLDNGFLAKANTSYAIVISTASSQYTLWRAKLGENDVNLGLMVNQQPYTQGIMFTSSLDTAFSPDNNSDIKFGINVAQFSTTGEVVFKPMLSNSGFDTMMLTTDVLTPDNTGINWYFRTYSTLDSNGSQITNQPWQPLTTGYRYRAGATFQTVQFKADLTASNYMSPLLSADATSLGDWLSSTSGTYIGETIDATTAPYNNVSISYTTFLTSDSNVTPYYSSDGGNTWLQMTNTPTVTPINNGGKQYTYTQQTPNGVDATSFKVRLDIFAQNSYDYPRVKDLMCVFIHE